MTLEERTAPPPPDAGPAAAPGSIVNRIAIAAALGLLVGLLVTANRTVPEQGRLGQRVAIVGLIEAEQARNAELAARAEQLSAELAAYERDDRHTGSEPLTALSAEVDTLAASAGMTAVTGPGVVTTLRDSRTAPPAGSDYNDYVIHEQDLQAVINALWAGGAEAMSVNGNRILTTTAIRCVGNVLLLHGSTHSPPYVIEAIGDVQELRSALDRDPVVQRFAEAVTRFQLGYTVEATADLVLPAYEGVSGMQHARPVDAAGPA